MNTPIPPALLPYLLGALALFTIGWICLLTQRIAIKQVIAIKLMLQGVSLVLVLAGRQQDKLALAQALVVSALIVETVVIALALAMIVNVFRRYPQGDVDLLRKLRG
jgi:NADH:ubiquinone oxidoreductase subunit K